jgi:hypothetical protein
MVICNAMNSKKNKNSIKIKWAMNVLKTCYIEMHGCNL